jgi:predicted Zn-dependent protease
LSKGKFPTAISRPTQEKKYGKMSDETWRKYIEVRGQNLKSLILKRKDSLEKLDAERYDDAIENLTDIANDRARATLKMRPAPK